MHQSASRPSSGRFTACQWLAEAIFLSHVGRGTQKTREPTWCLAHRATSRELLGTCRRRSRSPASTLRPHVAPARRHRRGAAKTSRRSFAASLRLRATQHRAAPVRRRKHKPCQRGSPLDFSVKPPAPFHQGVSLADATPSQIRWVEKELGRLFRVW